MKTFRPYEPDQMLLLPPSLSDWVPENHLARFVSDVVDMLDLSVSFNAEITRRMLPCFATYLSDSISLSCETGFTSAQNRGSTSSRHRSGLSRRSTQRFVK